MAYRGNRGSMVLLLALGLAFGAGCSGKKKKKKKKKSDLPPAQVSLPDPPPASELKIPEKNDDGTFRVRGLIAHRGKHFGESIELKGIISYISPDCDPTEAKKKGKECPQPYMFVKDSADADAKLMIVGYDHEFLEKNDLREDWKERKEDEEEPKPHVFKGTYKKLAQGFVATENGLLLVDKIDDKSVLKDDEEK